MSHTTSDVRTDLLLRVDDLQVLYGGRQVSSLPSLSIAPGEVVAIVGESGSGKSTALMAILGLLNGTSAQVRGSIDAFGTQVVGSSERQMRSLRGSEMTLIMQSPQASLNPTMRLRTLIHRALRRHGIDKSEAASRIQDAMTAVRLDEKILDRYAHEVSGGQAQRFAIALSVCLGARLIAADEPTSALDATVQLEVLTLIHRLAQERSTAWLVVAHDLAMVSMIADHVVVMRNGEVLEAGSTRTVLGEPQHEYTRTLLDAVPTLPGEGVEHV
ncbi:ATP-binding cassette domain-containing protein [Nocardioides kongjuensis]|uniref:ABC-type glutathione transport system ATPase component n=1 Tax=Nocardioides kongjuensis TaxID=349522 RepID=A0A852RY47_9ACTN|nr:ABC transporter ATP-binding protein [Nocardioides kongjuensis]NYD32774.1 ABC-type glutathione transport system ATPase component [Nocardioides kongjuensis]